jgi:hypothetical protein
MLNRLIRKVIGIELRQIKYLAILACEAKDEACRQMILRMIQQETAEAMFWNTVNAAYKCIPLAGSCPGAPVTCPYAPGGSCPGVPGGSCPYVPGMVCPAPQAPGSSGPAPSAPGGTCPFAPGGTCPAASGGTCPYAPAGTCPGRPGGSCPFAPGGRCPFMPGGSCPFAPGGSCPGQGVYMPYSEKEEEEKK